MDQIPIPIEESGSLRGSSSLIWETPKIEKSSFDELLEEVQQDEDLRLQPKRIDRKSRGILKEDDPGYDCSHMSTWRWWKNGTIYIPGHGQLLPTQHAKRQIGSQFGIKYDAFLGPMKGDPELIQKALQPHVNARREDPNLTVKVVARSFPGKDAPLGVDGILRGVVSTRYAQIRDVDVLGTLRRIGGSELQEMRITHVSRTDEATYFNVVYPATKRIKALSKVGDEVLSGFKGWNSEVGGKSLGFAEFLLRLVCSNGMVVNVPGDQLLHRRHTYLSVQEMEKLLQEMWGKLPTRFERIAASAEMLDTIPINDPDKEIDRFVGSQGQPKYIREAVKKAFKMEPIGTAYGILQALTKMATAAHIDPNRQLDLENLGGRYLLQMAPLAA